LSLAEMVITSLQLVMMLIGNITLRASEAAVQCIIIGSVWVCLWVCVCGSVTTITWNSVHWSSPNCVCRWRWWPSPAD